MSDAANKVHLNDRRPKVSVIVPVYNTEKYLARCLDSVIGQTERNLEIVCVNDGSTDGSAAILERYAAADPRVQVVTQENGGLSAARNSGLDVATGEYVMFVDSDDWIPSDAVAKMLRAAEESCAPVVVSAEYAKDRLKKPRRVDVRWTLRHPALKRLVGQRKIQSSACNKLYRSDIIRNRRFIEGIYFEDWPFITELFGDIESFALVDEPMYVYFTGETSIVRSPFTEKKAVSYLTGINHIAAFFRGRPDEDIARRRIALAVKMLVSKAVRSRDSKIRTLVGTQDFSSYPLDLKTRFRMWRLWRRSQMKSVTLEDDIWSEMRRC